MAQLRSNLLCITFMTRALIDVPIKGLGHIGAPQGGTDSSNYVKLQEPSSPKLQYLDLNCLDIETHKDMHCYIKIMYKSKGSVTKQVTRLGVKAHILIYNVI